MERDYITCHILDTVKGSPAQGIPCTLSKLQDGKENVLAHGNTDKDGRIMHWDSPVTEVTSGPHKVKFETGHYLSKANNGQAFFPVIEVVFVVSNPPDPHYHIPLLLSNYSYSTYRGS